MGKKAKIQGKKSPNKKKKKKSQNPGDGEEADPASQPRAHTGKKRDKEFKKKAGPIFDLFSERCRGGNVSLQE